MSPPKRVAFRPPRRRRFWAPLQAAAAVMAWTARVRRRRRGQPCAFRRPPAPRHCWRVTRSGHSGPPGAQAISLSSRAPAACTWKVDGPIHVPSQQDDASIVSGSRKAPGIADRVPGPGCLPSGLMRGQRSATHAASHYPRVQRCCARLRYERFVPGNLIVAPCSRRSRTSAFGVALRAILDHRCARRKMRGHRNDAAE
jgi:hypothetical protein